jgi:hypothetical protein
MTYDDLDKLIVDIDEVIERDDGPQVRRLLVAHPQLLHLDVGNKTWLHRAAQKGCLESVKALVALGLDANAPRPKTPDTSPEGPVYSAVIGGHAHVVKWLLEHGANSNCTVNGVVRNFALSSAASNGHFEIVQLLVEHGADVNAAWGGMNALSNARGHPEIYAYLCARGAVEPTELTAPTDSLRQMVEKHVTKHVGKPAPLSQQEIVPGDPPISIHLISPTGTRKRVTLVTTGMSDRPMIVPKGGEEYQFAELLIDLLGDWPTTPKKLSDPTYSWPLDCLRRLARYPHDHNLWLGGARAVVANGDPPAPIAPGVPFTAFLLLTSDQPEDRLALLDGRVVHFYRVFPLYTEEYRLEREQGTDALIKLFQRHKVAMTADPTRKNVAKPRVK